MKLGIPKEVKTHEYRVSVTPGAVKAFVDAGHEVFVEAGAGIGSGFADDDYEAQGATVVGSAEEAWAQPMVMKVKEPIEREYDFLRDDQLLFTYLHLAADKPLTDDLLDACGDPATMGKNARKDIDRGKATYPALLGIEQSRQRAAELASQAQRSLDRFDHRADSLRTLAEKLVHRKR